MRCHSRLFIDVPELPDSHPDKWQYTEHTRAKHEILNRYLGAWLSILGSRIPLLLLVDGFAGRGVYTGGEPGSPRIMFERSCEVADSGRAERVTILAVERDTANFAQLEGVCSALNHPAVSIEAHHERFENYAAGLIAELERRAFSPPTFVMIDPFGFSGVKLATLARLLRISRVEVLLTFMARDMARFLERPNIGSTMTEFFGGTAWQKCLKNDVEDRAACLFQQFKETVRPEIARFATAFRVFEDERQTTLYYLVHLSNHDLGMRRMKEAMVKESEDMTFWPITLRNPDQLHLDVAEQSPFPSLQAHLTEAYAGCKITFLELLNRDYSEGIWVERDYRASLKAMEEADPSRVIVKRPRSTPSGRPPSGIQYPDELTFP